MNRFASTLRRLFARKIVLVAAAVLLLVVATATVFPWLSDADPNATAVSQRLHAPSADHWAGTDELGRDVLLRIVHGARYSLLIGAITAAGAVVAGTVLGMLAGFFRRLIQRVDHSINVLVRNRRAFVDGELALQPRRLG